VLAIFVEYSILFDIYYGKASKVGGVLCASTWDGQRFHVLVGLGLNVANEQPTLSLLEVARQCGADSSSLGRENLLAAVLNEFEEMQACLERDGFGPFQDEYLTRWLHSGQRVTLRVGAGDERIVDIEGLSPSGFLAARDAKSDERVELHPDTTRLNFWENFLVGKKL